ncbi:MULTISPECIES: sulfatase [unclassified Nocardioides]|uniref:sulfatase family protein n=1 Tax=unclassified Nocardioides TaxID=2615069 RepID=UPI00360ADA73
MHGIRRRHYALIAAAMAVVSLGVMTGISSPVSSARPAIVAAAEDRPNILVVTVDDMREDELAYMPQTRALLGDEGVQFVNSFSPYPLCCPARSSFLTGLYTHNHRVWSHEEPWGFKVLRDDETLPVWLQRAGYRTHFLGKYLNGYGAQPAPDGSSDNSRTYIPPGWSDWRGAIDGGLGAGHPKDGGTYRFFNTTLNDNGEFYLEPGVYQTDVFGGLTEDIITEEAGDARPFFAWVNYVAPHHGNPREPDDPGPITRDDGKVTQFSTTARPASVRGRFDDVLTKAPGAAGEDDVSDKPVFIRDLPPLNAAEQAGLLETARQRAEAISLVDDEVARTVAALKRTGQLENTILAFTSDNGYFLGEHRIRQGKILPYDPALRVPLLIRGPGIPAGEVRHDPFTSIDFAPTILAAAETSVDWPLNGANLLPVARGGDTGWKRAVLTETGPRGTIATLDESGPQLHPRDPGPTALRYSQGVRTKRYLYVEHASGDVELYDLHHDPNQLDNVAGDEPYAEDQAALATTLDQLRNCRGGACRAPIPKQLQAGP